MGSQQITAAPFYFNICATFTEPPSSQYTALITLPYFIHTTTSSSAAIIARKSFLKPVHKVARASEEWIVDVSHEPTAITRSGKTRWWKLTSQIPEPPSGVVLKRLLAARVYTSTENVHMVRLSVFLPTTESPSHDVHK